MTLYKSKTTYGIPEEQGVQGATPSKAPPTLRDSHTINPNQPHIEIHRAVNRIDEVVERLEQVIRSITEGTDAVCDESVIDKSFTNPSLVTFLNETSDEINRKVEHAHQVIDDINNLLFGQ